MLLYTHCVSRIDEQRTEFVQLLQCNDCSFLSSQRKGLNDPASPLQVRPSLHRLSFFRMLLFAAVKCSKNRTPLPAGCCID